MNKKERLYRNLKMPWLKYYSKEELNLNYRDISLYEELRETSLEYADVLAYIYFDRGVTYQKFLKQIDECSRSLKVMGVHPGDIVTLCMPNIPEAIISFYAINKIGAISNLIHPLLSEKEMKEELNLTSSKTLIVIDICYEKIKKIRDETGVQKIIIVSVSESMPIIYNFGYQVTKGYKVSKISSKENYLKWRDFIRLSRNDWDEISYKFKKDEPAVILNSGGTTGIAKGVILTNENFQTLITQGRIFADKIFPGDIFLGLLPIFHGFGLGVNIHIPFSLGATVVLMPQYNKKDFIKILRKYKPTFLAAVPTLYEALIKIDEDLDLSCLKYVISGGDTLSNEQIDKYNAYLEKHNCTVKIMQGYGMTESIGPTVAAFKEATNKKGSVGIPFPDNYIKIVIPGTHEELENFQDGEICISSKTVMLGYLNNEQETNLALQRHKDGLIWLHTGDIGYLDDDGVLYFKGRLKRMIITSGHNVYPNIIESVLLEHDAILNCTVIGIPHPNKIQVPKAYIVLKNNFKDNSTLRKSIKEHCERNLIKYSIPKEFEFRASLPRTLIGKIDFKKLEEENKNID